MFRYSISTTYTFFFCMFHLWLQDTDGSVIPPPIPLSSEHVSDDGIYLLENGEDCLIYVGGSVDPDITQKLFGVSSFSEIPTQVHLIFVSLVLYHYSGKMASLVMGINRLWWLGLT